jgi:flagellar basal-body rod protein FlgB
MTMGIQNLFGGNFPLLEKSLSLRARRQELIVSNIANADTPNYKSFDMIIEDELQKTSETPRQIPLKITNTNHLDRRGTGVDQVTIHKNESDDLSLRGDGNTVDMETEMVNLSENALMYKTSTHIMGKMFTALRTAINGGK